MLIVFVFSLLLVLSSSSGDGSSGETGCGWVDVGSVTLRLDSCYVQCQEVTQECWDQKFYCDDGKLRVTFFRDAEENCGGVVTADKVIADGDHSVEAYDCEGTVSGDSQTCHTFHYIDNVHNMDTDECGFLQVDVKLVADACFSGDKGKYFKQNCDAEYTSTICDDDACSVNCITRKKNIFGLEADHCMHASCSHAQTQEIVGTPVFIKGTYKLKYINYLNPRKWTLSMWTAASILTLLFFVLCLQFRIYKNTKGSSGDYHLVKTISDSETEKMV